MTLKANINYSSKEDCFKLPVFLPLFHLFPIQFFMFLIGFVKIKLTYFKVFIFLSEIKFISASVNKTVSEKKI